MANELIKTNNPIKNIEDALACGINSVNGTVQTGSDWTTIFINQADKRIYLSGGWRLIKMVKFTIGAGATANIKQPTPAGYKLYVLGWEFSCDTDGTTFKFQDDTPTDYTNAQTYMKGGGEKVIPDKLLLFALSAADKILQGTTTIGAVNGTVWFTQF